MPIIKFRRQYTDLQGNTITIVSTNVLLETINVVYDYIYSPIKNYVNKSNKKTDKKTDNREDIWHILYLIEDTNIYNDLLFCLENKDNKKETLNVKSIIRKYNIHINDNINTICYYLINYLNADNKSHTLNSNKIYYI